jgi:hypothetical protein
VVGKGSGRVIRRANMAEITILVYRLSSDFFMLAISLLDQTKKTELTCKTGTWGTQIHLKR